MSILRGKGVSGTMKNATPASVKKEIDELGIQVIGTCECGKMAKIVIKPGFFTIVCPKCGRKEFQANASNKRQ